MRIVAFFDKEKLANHFALFLKAQKVESYLESSYDLEKKKIIYNIWVLNEDDLEKAQKLYKDFSSEPENVRYDLKTDDSFVKDDPKENKIINIDPMAMNKALPYKITFFFLFLCITLFFVNFMQEAALLKKYKFKQVVMLTPLQTAFLYDVPKVRLKLDKVIIKYHLDSLKKLENPPQEAQEEIEKISKEPTWPGLYDIILNKLQKKKKDSNYLLFEKIRKKELWRLFTPAILHSGFLHILFNMLWLWYLGKQIEPRLGALKYILFILIVAVGTNTVQYLIGGPYFLGFSGIITGMLGYIFVRQKVAPWEGYNVPNMVFYFIAIFIFAMLFLQITAFFFQIFKPKAAFTPGIANTAHIVGIIMGMILAKTPLFQWRAGER